MIERVPALVKWLVAARLPPITAVAVSITGDTSPAAPAASIALAEMRTNVESPS